MLPTPQNPTGPAWRRGAPFRDQLAPAGYRWGRPLHLDGRVLRTDGTPIAGAVIDLWHASPWGLYDMLSRRMRFRGKVRTDAEGQWAARTVVPGGYLWRPRHVHLRLEGDGRLLLITQLYLGRDLRQRVDPHVDPLLVVPLGPDRDGHHVRYDLIVG